VRSASSTFCSPSRRRFPQGRGFGLATKKRIALSSDFVNMATADVLFYLRSEGPVFGASPLTSGAPGRSPRPPPGPPCSCADAPISPEGRRRARHRPRPKAPAWCAWRGGSTRDGGWTKPPKNVTGRRVSCETNYATLTSSVSFFTLRSNHSRHPK
jgi:hypothetical protein